MRPNCRFCLKWSALTIVSAIVFHYLCDSLVGKVLSLNNWSIFETQTREMIWNYEKSLIDWAHSGQRTDKRRAFEEKSETRDDLELIGVHVFFRHGARTPLHLLPNLEEVRLDAALHA